MTPVRRQHGRSVAQAFLPVPTLRYASIVNAWLARDIVLSAFAFDGDRERASAAPTALDLLCIAHPGASALG